jgi:hypothetical protein
MLGLYDNFPVNVHKTASFTTSISSKRLQQALIQIFNETNGKTYNLEDVADPSVPQCTVIFEFGIAEANNFNYLDNKEANKVLKVIQKKPLQIMDFYCAIRYYKTQKEKQIPLKFDYYMIRLIFSKNSMETRAFHERGLRYISPEDITDFIADKINDRFSKKILKPHDTA